MWFIIMYKWHSDSFETIQIIVSPHYCVLIWQPANSWLSLQYFRISEIFSHNLQEYRVYSLNPSLRKATATGPIYIEHTSCNPSFYPLFAATCIAVQPLIQFASKIDRFGSRLPFYNLSLRNQAWISLSHFLFEFYSPQVQSSARQLISQHLMLHSPSLSMVAQHAYNTSMHWV